MTSEMPPYRTGPELRELFLNYFESRGHTRLPSSSLVPQDDPTLLFTTAGMVQFKPYFLGVSAPPNRRLTTVQKSFRTTDIGEVGDTTHLTFFEMLGNFSFGDYFKQGAIGHAWELCTQSLGLNADRLWATAYTDDDETARLWEQTGVPAERIRRFGASDNWWGPAGNSGPCGPCSEIHYDLTPGEPFHDDSCGPNCECGRFVEIWNLVFMEFDQAEDGSRTPLEQKNIDTGMGLERLAAIIQRAENIYATDLFQPVIARAEAIAGFGYGQDGETDRALRVMAEHARSGAFLIMDGVTPGNEGRGYVLRRMLRRGIRFAQRLGVNEPFLGRIITEAVIPQMASAYPALIDARDHIVQTVTREEEQFQRTLSVGIALLDEVMARMEADAESVVPGDTLFRLYDTYGFPVELAEEIALDRGMSVDREGFQQEMDEQRARGRAATTFGGGAEGSEAHRLLSGLSTQFTGYDVARDESTVTGLIVGGGVTESASRHQQVEIVTARTPFYPEGGGQVGDVGVIRGPSGLARITDTQRPVAERPEFIVHIGIVEEGTLSIGDTVTLEVDPTMRGQSTRHHTATHLLHAALRATLGGHVRQAGSYVSPDHLRFDFSHMASLNEHEIAAVTHAVNARVIRNIVVQSQAQPIQDALASGALAFFGDRYGSEVRTVSIAGESGGAPFSHELCGGTHVHATGEVGFIYVVSESSVGAGMRRVEAVAGSSADDLLRSRMSVLERLSRQLTVPVDEIEARIADQMAEADRLRRRTEELERERARSQIQTLLQQTTTVGEPPITLLSARVSDITSVELLRDIADKTRSALGSGIVVLGADVDGRPSLACAISADIVERGDAYDAARIVKQAAAIVGGGGGGRKYFASAGGRDASKLDEALTAVAGIVTQ